MRHSDVRPGQVVRDRSRPGLRGVSIVVGLAKTPGLVWVCRWRGAQLHWTQPVALAARQFAPVVDWTEWPLTEAKRLAATAFERNFLVRAMEAAEGSVVDAALAVGVDRSNFRRLLQRHGLAEVPKQPKRRQTTKKSTKKRAKQQRRAR